MEERRINYMTTNDIYEALKHGKSGDDLAKEFTSQLNKAQKRIKDEEAKAAQAKQDAKLRIEAAEGVLRALKDYVLAAQPKYATFFDNISAKDCAKAIDSAILYHESFSKQFDRFKSLFDDLF